MKEKANYAPPQFTTVGTASSLTMGGYYNDYDSPGIRQSRSKAAAAPAKKAKKKTAKKKAAGAKKKTVKTAKKKTAKKKAGKKR